MSEKLYLLLKDRQLNVYHDKDNSILEIFHNENYHNIEIHMRIQSFLKIFERTKTSDILKEIRSRIPSSFDIQGSYRDFGLNSAYRITHDNDSLYLNVKHATNEDYNRSYRITKRFSVFKAPDKFIVPRSVSIRFEEKSGGRRYRKLRFLEDTLY